MNKKEVNETGEDGGEASVPPREGRFDKYVGALSVFKSIKEINAWVREIRGDEDRVPDE
ncbi:MAG: hypothetical protein WBD10_15665 [Acidobacteriaceae bacterium]